MEPVFVSYVRENQNVIDRICNHLKKNNIPYWLDREKIDPGKNWKTSIRNAIKKGSMFIACFSIESINKQESVMNEEISLAIDILRLKQFDSGWIIPLKLNECDIPDIEIGGGRYLKDIQYIDLYPSFPKNIKKLTVYLKNKFSKDILVNGKNINTDNFDIDKILFNFLRGQDKNNSMMTTEDIYNKMNQEYGFKGLDIEDIFDHLNSLETKGKIRNVRYDGQIMEKMLWRSIM